MDVLPLVPVGSLVAVVSWLIWPVIQDAFDRASPNAEAFDGDADDMAEVLFDVWSAHGDQTGLISPNATT